MSNCSCDRKRYFVARSHRICSDQTISDAADYHFAVADHCTICDCVPLQLEVHIQSTKAEAMKLIDKVRVRAF